MTAPQLGRRIGMMVTNDLRLDSRVRREAGSLAAAGFEVTVYGVLTPATADEPIERTCGFTIHRLPMLTSPIRAPEGAMTATTSQRPIRVHPLGIAAAVFQRTRPFLGGTIHFAVNWQFRWRRWARRVAATAEPADIWHAHDLNALPAAIACANRMGGRIVYDSHEIFTESGSTARLPRIVRGALRWQERRWSARCEALITVNQPVGDYLTPALNSRRTLVLHNCAEPHPDARRTPYLRDAIGLPADAPLVLYHGSVVEHRGLPQAVRALLEPPLRGVHLAVMGYGAVRPELEQLARELGVEDRFHLLPPVPPADVVRWVAGADVAVMPIQPSTLNHVLSTPNKLFEALAAGVPVVGPSFAAFAHVLRDPDYGMLGRVCNPRDPADIAAAVGSLLSMDPEAMDDLRRRCLAAADRRWNWEAESVGLVGLYEAILSPRAQTGQAGGRFARPVRGTGMERRVSQGELRVE